MSAEQEIQQIPQNTESSKSGFYWVLSAFICLIIIVFLNTPAVIRASVKSNLTHATSNAKQLGIALFTFEQEFGTYPSPSTVADVTAAFPSHGYDLTGNSSNALFRQLFAAKVIDTEEIFYAKIMDAIKPDGVIIPKEALKKGECGFAYITGMSSQGNPSCPLVLAPVIPGTKKFDPKPFDGKAIALHIDQTVKAYQIQKDGTIHDKDGDILSPEHPMWNGKAPDIRYPE